MAVERPGGTLDATALVHEAWLRMQGSSPEHWRDRRQFFAAAAEAMRRILVEAARRRLALKRGAGEHAVPLDGLDLTAPVTDERLLGIHEVLDQLETEDETKARIVKLRFFSGMNHDEIAATGRWQRSGSTGPWRRICEFHRPLFHPFQAGMNIHR